MRSLNPPNPEIVQRVRTRLEELNINLNQEVIAVVAAAYDDVVQHTNIGKQHLVNLFEMEWSQGQSDETYEVLDGMGRAQEKVNGKDVWLLKTLVAKGQFLTSRQIARVQIEVIGCDKCGIMSHCTRQIRDRHSSHTERVCNHCLILDDTLRDQGDTRQCKECTKALCEYHPSRSAVRTA